MTVTYGLHVTLHARPGRGDEVVSLLLDLDYDDCPVLVVSRGIDDPDLIYVIEGWTSKEAQARSNGTEQTRAFLAKVHPLLAREDLTVAVPVGGRAKF